MSPGQLAKDWGALAVLAAGFVALAGFLDDFQTEAEAAEKWTHHDQLHICATVTQLKRDKLDLTKQLQLDKSLTDADKAWLQEQIRDLQAQIEKLDPKGVC